MDYATKSSRLYQNALNLWKRDSSWIEAESLLQKTKKDLNQFIKIYLKPRYPNEITIRFEINAQKLKEEYRSQAINIVNSSKNARDLLDSLRNKSKKCRRHL